MQIVSITTQGQVTIPSDIREEMGFKTGGKALFRKLGKRVVVEPVEDLLDFGGRLNKFALSGKSISEIMKTEKAAVAKAVAGKYSRE